jgi:PAS domain S-box-containing protein
MLLNVPIRRKLMIIVLVTTGTALLLTCIGFVVAQLFTARQTTTHQLATLGAVIASNSTAALAFEDQETAQEILAALSAEPRITVAALLDAKGNLFATYPRNAPASALQWESQPQGYFFQGRYLRGSQPITQDGATQLGTLLVQLDMASVYEQLLLYGGITALLSALALSAAYLLSRILQRQISQPILALAEMASAVSDRGDYSVRAPFVGRDELGRLTDAFNLMLTQIQSQHGALLESEARVRAVIDSALTAVVVTDAASRVLDYNRRAEAMFGWTRADAVGIDLATILSPLRQDMPDPENAQPLPGARGPVLNQLIETTALRKDGGAFPVDISVSALKTGEALTYCIFVTDITERKQAQRRIEAQLSRLSLLNRITRAVGDRQDLPSMFRVVLQNLEDNMPLDFAAVLLYGPDPDVLAISSLGSRSDAIAARLSLQQTLRITKDDKELAPCLRGELIYDHDISSLSWSFSRQVAAAGMLSLVIAPLHAEGRMFGVVVAARQAANAFSSADCEFLLQLSEHVALASHQAHLYRALQQAYDDLQQTQKTVMQQERLRALGQMASGVAHDINNAISPIALYTESLLEREIGLSDRARTYLSTIQRSIEDVAATVARMREFYRPREPQLVLGRVDLNNIAQQVIELTRARWQALPQERGVVIDMQTELEPGLPIIMGAESEIRDALTNLIFNAVDAMPAGGTLRVRTRSLRLPESDVQHGDRVALEVSDTGFGMSEETRQRCLEPFYTTKGERGTGLGLAMVYGMIQRHSAELKIDSVLNQGTTIAILFSVPQESGAPIVRLPTLQTVVRTLRVLIIDDDPLIIAALQEILVADGHLVVAADGGRNGIEQFLAANAGNQPFDVVFTDLGMPYVDGRQVAAEIKAVSDTPVVLLTGWGQRLLADDEVPPYVDRVLNKPPKLRELRSALAEITARRP